MLMAVATLDKRLVSTTEVWSLLFDIICIIDCTDSEDPLLFWTPFLGSSSSLEYVQLSADDSKNSSLSKQELFSGSERLQNRSEFSKGDSQFKKTVILLHFYAICSYSLD